MSRTMKVYQDGGDFYEEAEDGDYTNDRLVWEAPTGVVQGDEDLVGAAAAKRLFEATAAAHHWHVEFVS